LKERQTLVPRFIAGVAMRCPTRRGRGRKKTPSDYTDSR